MKRLDRLTQERLIFCHHLFL